MSNEQYPTVIRFGFMSILLCTVALFGGCAALEPGRGNSLAEPPLIKSAEQYEKEREKVFASQHSRAQEVRAPEAMTLNLSIAYVDRGTVPLQFRPAPATREIGVGGPAGSRLPQEFLRGELLRHQLMAQSMRVLGEVPTIPEGLGEFASRLPVALKERSLFSFNRFGKSDHYSVVKEGKPHNKRNTGGGIRVAMSAVSGRYGSAFLELNALMNTTGGATFMVCPGVERLFFLEWGFSFSGALGVCAGTYQDRYDDRTLPIFGFFPGISIKDEYGSSLNLVFLLKNPFLPIGKAAGSLSYFNYKPEETSRQFSKEGFEAFGGLVAIRKAFDPFFIVEKP